MDEDNRITVTVTDQKREPQEGLTVIIKGDLGQKETGETDENGKLTVPAVVESEYHGAYVVGYRPMYSQLPSVRRHPALTCTASTSSGSAQNQNPVGRLGSRNAGS